MKKTFLLLPLTAIAMMGCGIGNGNEAVGLKTDSVVFEQNTKAAEVRIYADCPTAGTPILTNAIAEYVNESLGGTYMGNLQAGDSLLAYYGNNIAGKLKADYDYVEDDSRMPYAYEMNIKKTYETGRFVTFTATSYYYTGGAHGMSLDRGTTFRKTDGRRFDLDMLCNTGSDEFRKMIKEGLKSYFSDNGETATTDEELKEMLLTESSTDYLPLPQFAPYLTEEGVTFVYQQYEIAPYAAGMPTFTIPYDKMKPYLTVTARNLIEK